MVRFLFVVAVLCTTPASWSAQEATTNDGMRVMLHDDGTWKRIAQKNENPKRAGLMVERVEEMPSGCRIGMRLRNHLSAPVRSLMLRFTAYKQGPVAYETVTRSFSFIKPNASQYQDILFRGIACSEIAQLQVHGADKCHVGELTPNSSDEKSCLALIHVSDSHLIEVFK